MGHWPSQMNSPAFLLHVSTPGPISSTLKDNTFTKPSEFSQSSGPLIGPATVANRLPWTSVEFEMQNDGTFSETKTSLTPLRIAPASSSRRQTFCYSRPDDLFTVTGVVQLIHFCLFNPRSGHRGSSHYFDCHSGSRRSAAKVTVTDHTTICSCTM